MSKELNSNSYLFLAEPFGFGPISSSIAVVRQIKKLNPKKQCIFVGSGTSYQLAAISHAFDELHFNDNLIEHSFSMCGENVRPSNCIVIANTYPVGVAVAKRADFLCVFIDTLFWMWNKIPINISDVERYYIEDFHCTIIDQSRFGYSNKFKKIPPLIDIDASFQRVSRPFLLVSLGGIDSNLYDFPVFYDDLIEYLSQKARLENLNILICGGGKRFFNNEFERFENSNLKIKCLDHRKYIGFLKSADFVLASAGLHSFYENLYLNKNVMFLPPQSYSQYMQLKLIVKNFPGVVAMNFEQLGVAHSLRENMPDSERVCEVKRTNNVLVEGHVLKQFFCEFEKFCSGQLQTDWACGGNSLPAGSSGPRILAEDVLSFT